MSKPGLPGAGKTSLARRLADEIPAVRLCEDEWMIHLGLDLFDEAARDRLEELFWQLAQSLLRSGPGPRRRRVRPVRPCADHNTNADPSILRHTCLTVVPENGPGSGHPFVTGLWRCLLTRPAWSR